MAYNHPRNEVTLKTMNGVDLEVVEDIKYLGSWCGSSQANISARRASVWQSCDTFSKIWKSTLSRALKVTVVESVLLYVCEVWTMMKSLEKQLGGYYKSMQRMATNTHWTH